MTQGRVSEACPLFEQSQRLDAGIGTQYNLAACYEALGRVASAYALFLEVSATAQARGQTERARAAAQAVLYLPILIFYSMKDRPGGTS